MQPFPKKLMYMSSSIFLMTFFASLFPLSSLISVGHFFYLLHIKETAFLTGLMLVIGAFIGYLFLLFSVSFFFLKGGGKRQLKNHIVYFYSIKTFITLIFLLSAFVGNDNNERTAFTFLIAGRALVLFPTLWLSTPFIISNYLTGNYQLKKEVCTYLTCDFLMCVLVALMIKEPVFILVVSFISILYFILVGVATPYIIRKNEFYILHFKEKTFSKKISFIVSATYSITSFLGVPAMIIWFVFA